MAVHVVGGGALGTMVAARLVKAGVEARLVVREGSAKAALAASSRVRCTVTEHSESSSFEVDVPVLCRVPASARGGRFVLCTKAFDAAAAVAAHCDASATVALLCNGALALRDLPCSAVSATTTHGCFETEPFRVVHAGLGRVWLRRDAAFVDDFDRAGLRPVPLDDQQMADRLWKKLAANAVLNPLTALFECANGDALPRASDEAMAVCREIARVRAALDGRRHHDGDDDAAALYEDVVECASENARNFSSMYQDVKNRRRTEIDFLNGWIADSGRRLNIPTPANDALIAQIAAKLAASA